MLDGYDNSVPDGIFIAGTVKMCYFAGNPFYGHTVWHSDYSWSFCAPNLYKAQNTTLKILKEDLGNLRVPVMKNTFSKPLMTDAVLSLKETEEKDLARALGLIIIAQTNLSSQDEFDEWIKTLTVSDAAFIGYIGFDRIKAITSIEREPIKNVAASVTLGSKADG